MIQGVALKFTKTSDFIWLDKPCRHHNLFALAKQFNRDIIGSEQGFWIWGEDNKRKFLTREEAWEHAIKCDQLLPDIRRVEGVLFTENVW